MKSFLETICIKDGVPQHLDWHQQRVNTTFQFCIPHADAFSLAEALTQYDFPDGILKCTILYDSGIIEVKYTTYIKKKIESLRLIEVPAGYQYHFKFADRQVIRDLFSQRGEADDILMMREGWILDTSLANVAFRKKDSWYTPSFPLLAGTTWKRLISEKQLVPKPLHQKDIRMFETFKIFNAMRDWGEIVEMPIGGIY